MDCAIKKVERLEVVDALRGFAVMTILLVHSLEHFIFPVYPDPLSQPHWLQVLDTGVFNITFSLFAGKSYAIFALLFGLTFHIQFTNQQQKGNDFGLRFLWRLLLLAGFATLNAAFFPAGDVLLLFSIVGIILFIVRKWSNRAIFLLAAFFLLQPVEWFHFFRSIVDPHYTLPDLGVGGMYQFIADNTKNGTFGSFIYENITLGQKASLLWAVGAGRYLQTAGLFLLGLLLGRTRRFEINEQNIRFWVKILILSAILFAPLYRLKEMTGDENMAENIRGSYGIVIDMWQKLAFTFVLIASFVILYQNHRFRKLTHNLRYYGRMSLSNYISQSIMGALIYFPIGLYLAPYCGYAISFVIGFGLFLLQVQFCKWWLAKYKQGPLESIWHKWTWLFSGKSH